LPAAAPPRTYITHVRAPRTRSPFRVRPARGVDLCLLDTASGATGTLAVPFSTRARRTVAEAQAGIRMAFGLAYLVVAARGHTSWPTATELSRRVRRE